VFPYFRIYVSTYLGMYVCMDGWMDGWMYVMDICMYVCMYECMYACICIWVSVCACERVYVCMYVWMYVCLSDWLSVRACMHNDMYYRVLWVHIYIYNIYILYHEYTYTWMGKGKEGKHNIWHFSPWFCIITQEITSCPITNPVFWSYSCQCPKPNDFG